MILLLILAIVFVSLFVYTTGSFIAYSLVNSRPMRHYFLCDIEMKKKHPNTYRRTVNCSDKRLCDKKQKSFSILIAVFWLPLILELGSRRLGEYLLSGCAFGPQSLAKKIVGGLDLGPKQSYEELQNRNKELEKELGIKI